MKTAQTKSRSEGEEGRPGPSLPVVGKMSRLHTSTTADREGGIARDDDGSAADRKKKTKSASEFREFKIAAGSENEHRPIMAQLLCPHKNKLEQAAAQ